MIKMANLMILVFLLALIHPMVFSHCEIPCGIYNDEMRIQMISEHITTIEKAMKQVQELSKEDPKNFNQIVRWIVNKEKHAEEIQHVVSQYFLTQRIKVPDENDAEAMARYQKQLSLCHSLLVYAMKTKQTTDLTNVEKLKSLLHEFEHAYLGKKD